jgi:hypothetical protein
MTCSATTQPYDMSVVECTGGKAPCARDVAFVWRDPARAPAPAAASAKALAAPGGEDPPADGDPTDEGSAEAHEA